MFRERLGFVLEVVAHVVIDYCWLESNRWFWFKNA